MIRHSKRLRFTIGAIFVAATQFAMPSVSAFAQADTCTTQNLDDCLSDEQAAELLEALASARRAADTGDWAESLRHLERAEAVVSLGVTQAAIARAQFELGRLDEAHALCMTLLADPDPDARALASALLRDIEQSELVEPSGDDPSSLVAEESASEVAGSDDLVSPVPAAQPEPSRRSSNAALYSFASISVATLVPAIWAGARSAALEGDANNYDLTAEGATRQAQDDLGRASARHATAANALFVASGVFAGALVGALVERRVSRPALHVSPTRDGLVFGLRFVR